MNGNEASSVILYAADEPTAQCAKTKEEVSHCCWPAQLYYDQLQQYVRSLSSKELRAALKEFRACGNEGWNGPNSITYYPTIEVTFEGEDVYPVMRAELRRRGKRLSGKEVQ